jgi:IPT/TIG domain
VIGTGHYWTQLEYSNALGGCYQAALPTISSLSTQFALPGDTVDVFGTNLYGPLVARFNGLVANVDTVHSTPSDVKVVVPSGHFSGPVTVQTAGGTATSATSFFPAPTITSLAPLDGPVGTHVTITGANFVDVSSVSFGTIAAAFTPVSQTQLRVTIPAGLSSGRLSIVTPAGTVVSGDAFGVTDVGSLSIASGQARRTLMIFGQGLGSTTAVRFTSAADIAPVAVSATKVTVLVPPDATTGPVSVVTPRTVVAGPAFRPLPSVAGIAPLAAARGATVTISGANLTGATSVRFGTFSAASFTVVSPTQITATVPSSNAFTGGRVTVVTANGSANSAQSFLVRR